MQRLRFMHLLGGTTATLLGSLWLSGMAMAATTPSDLSSPNAVTSTLNVDTTAVSGVATTITKTTTSSLTQSQPIDGSGPTDPGAGNPPPASSGPVASTTPPPTTTGSLQTSSSNTSTAVQTPITTPPSSGSTGSGVLDATSSSVLRHLGTPSLWTNTPVMTEQGTTSLGLIAVAPVPPSHHPTTKAPIKATGLITQLTALLTQLLAPVGSTGPALVRGLAADLWPAALLSTLAIAVTLSVTTAGGYLSFLRRSGYAHAARSDADGFNATTPLLMGYSRTGLTGLVGGPFLVGSPVWTKLSQTNA